MNFVYIFVKKLHKYVYMSLCSRRIHSKLCGMGYQLFPFKYICILFMQF